MRNLDLLGPYRVNHPHLGPGDETCGCFVVPYPTTGVKLTVVAASGMGWDHVSVSLPNRCPNWLEMDAIKRLFFRDDEWAYQLHAPPSKHINLHPYCLHIWRPQGIEIPLPPPIMVGPSGDD